MPLSLNSSTIAAINAPSVTSYYLYEIDYAENEPSLCWTNYDVPVTYNSKTYTPFAIQHNDIGQGTDGSIQPVTLSVGNLDSGRVIQQAIEEYSLIGRSVVITQIIVGGLNSDMSDLSNIFKITSAKANKGAVTFSLSLGFDILMMTVPTRKVFSQFCNWQFKGIDGNCGYVGADAECRKSWQDCISKGNQRNFGGFPAVQENLIIF